MAHPAYLREKARQLRIEKKLTIDQLAECLALPRSMIYYWTRDIAIPRTERQTVPQRIGTRSMSKKYRLLREAAYSEGAEMFLQLCEDPTFRDFVNLYLAEGYKRDRNCASLCNSDPAVIRLATRWFRRLSDKRLFFAIQHHADQDPEDLRDFWSALLEIGRNEIRFYRKSNSNQLSGRRWRCRYGVMTVGVNDTYLRARMQAWMERLQESWLDSEPIGA